MRTILLISLTFLACQEPDPEDTRASDATGADGGEPDAGEAVTTPGPGRRLLRRLAHDEYANTVRDLLGLEVDAAQTFAADPIVHGFANHAEQLRVSALLVDQYRSLAERLASEVEVARVAPCGESGACARRFVRDFGLRMLRRPLTGDEAARYDALFDAAADEGFAAGVRLVVGALLQSPHFLYRTELGRQDDAGFVLTPYELATALSYLFWRTTPDPELLARAADGTLLDPTVRAQQIERLLADPRTTATARTFVTGWLGLDRLPQVNRDPETYPETLPDLRRHMAAETDTFVTRLWEGGGSLRDFLLESSDYEPMAPHYQGDPPGTRAGVLTQASLLTTWALPRSSSPIHRGLLVRERLLCQVLPPPPANLDTSPPPVDPALSTRERYARHADDPACTGCHQLIDPIGFAFEHFDGIGRYRARDGEHPIDARGEVLGVPDSQFDGAADLATLLADSPAVSACYARQWLRYGYGGEEVLEAESAIRIMAEALEAADGRLTAPLLALAEHPHFTRRRGGEAELDVPGAELTPDAPGAQPPEMIPDPPEPPDPPGPTGVVLTLEEVSRWETGYCTNGRVTNGGEGEVTWEVEAEIEGTINNLWNAVATANTGRLHFSGMPYNAVLGPGQNADFGFCASVP